MVRRRRFGRQYWNRFGKNGVFFVAIAGHLYQAARRRNLPRNNDGEVEQGAEPICAGAERGVKSVVLYPMNALVTDQLKRLRGNFGKESVADALKGDMSRRFQFGQYTGRTQFHGSYAKRGERGGSKNASSIVRKSVWKTSSKFTVKRGQGLMIYTSR